MVRGPTGNYITTTTVGEAVRAFVPHPLPPTPPLDLGGRRQALLERATLAIGRLDGISTLLPDKELFLYSYVRKEAVLSSQIEGTQSSLSDLLMFEEEQAPGAPIDDIVEVSNYVAALDHGLARIRGGFPLAGRLIPEIHGVLLAKGRGSSKEPGQYRRSQNWIGGTRPGNARFVPPPPEEVSNCISQLERFLHATDDGVPTLVRAGLAHVQFETIHPFLDGNGRVGRLLIPLLLVSRGVLRDPLLYLSLHFKQHRDTYYDLLDRVRSQGHWEAWIEFFLEGVLSVAVGAVATAERLSALFASERARIGRLGPRAGSVLRVHDALTVRPVRSITSASEHAGVSYPTASLAMQELVKIDIAKEITGRARGRLFAHAPYLAILSEGVE